MRPILLVAIIGVLLLASCNSAPEPTATPIPPTATEVIPPTSAADVPEDNLGDFTGTITVPVAGTLVIGDTGETPGAPTAPLTFDKVTFTQTGGAANVNFVIQLLGDGTLTRDGVTSTVSAEQVQQIASLLDQIHFYSMEGTFVSADSTADTYRYSLNVSSATGSRTVFSQDGLTPPELEQIYDALRALGRN